MLGFDAWAAVFSVVALLVGLVLHEFMHAFTADRFGDRTAREAGRLSLNPIRHVDPFGTVILPGLLIVLALSGAGSGAVFGYARPVPVVIANLRRPRLHSLLVSLAGPGTNLLLGLIGALALRTAIGSPRMVQFLLVWTIVNVFVAVFNALPVPPLDGSEIVAAALPGRLRQVWYTVVRKYGFILLFVVLITSPRILDILVDPVVRGILRLVLG